MVSGNTLNSLIHERWPSRSAHWYWWCFLFVGVVRVVLIVLNLQLFRRMLLGLACEVCALYEGLHPVGVMLVLCSGSFVQHTQLRVLYSWHEHHKSHKPRS